MLRLTFSFSSSFLEKESIKEEIFSLNRLNT
jgi:hypothetical protein